MEIWIIGGAVVALMVYTSTRIKKRAAEAYSREMVETARYSFIKPEGLICPADQLTDESAFVRSNNYGDTELTETILQLEGTLTVNPKAADSILDGLTPAGETIETRVSGKETSVRREITSGEVRFVEFYKLIEDETEKTFEFRVRIVKDYIDEFAAKAAEMTDSFHLKD